MKPIKLSQSQIDEGITEELLSKVNMKKKSSPVMFSKDDQPTEILRCQTGYWRSIGNGQYERDPKGALIVYDESDCIIARSRYLLYHEEEEVQAKADSILHERRKKIQEKLDIFKKNIDEIKQYQDPDSTVKMLASALESQMTQEQKERVQAENQRKIEALPKMEEQYQMLVSEFEKGNYNYLLDVMGIEKIANPVTFKLDNEDDMRILKNAFGGEATQKYEGDVNKMYARLAAEQQ